MRYRARAAVLAAFAAGSVLPASGASAAECVKVVVDYGTLGANRPVDTRCVNVGDGGTAADAIAGRARYKGYFLCAIDGYPEAPECGDQNPNPYWSVWYWASGSWVYSSRGVHDLAVADRDSDGHPDPFGFRFHEVSNRQPPRATPSWPAPATTPPRTPAPTRSAPPRTAAPTAGPGGSGATRGPGASATTAGPGGPTPGTAVTGAAAGPGAGAAPGAGVPTAGGGPTPGASGDATGASGVDGATGGDAAAGPGAGGAGGAGGGADGDDAGGGLPLGTVAGGVLALGLLGAAAWRFRKPAA